MRSVYEGELTERERAGGYAEDRVGGEGGERKPVADQDSGICS